MKSSFPFIQSNRETNHKQYFHLNNSMDSKTSNNKVLSQKQKILPISLVRNVQNQRDISTEMYNKKCQNTIKKIFDNNKQNRSINSIKIGGFANQIRGFLGYVLEKKSLVNSVTNYVINSLAPTKEMQQGPVIYEFNQGQSLEGGNILEKSQIGANKNNQPEKEKRTTNNCPPRTPPLSKNKRQKKIQKRVNKKDVLNNSNRSISYEFDEEQKYAYLNQENKEGSFSLSDSSVLQKDYSQMEPLSKKNNMNERIQNEEDSLQFSSSSSRQNDFYVQDFEERRKIMTPGKKYRRDSDIKYPRNDPQLDEDSENSQSQNKEKIIKSEAVSIQNGNVNHKRNIQNYKIRYLYPQFHKKDDDKNTFESNQGKLIQIKGLQGRKRRSTYQQISQHLKNQNFTQTVDSINQIKSMIKKNKKNSSMPQKVQQVGISPIQKKIQQCISKIQQHQQKGRNWRTLKNVSKPVPVLGKVILKPEKKSSHGRQTIKNILHQYVKKNILKKDQEEQRNNQIMPNNGNVIQNQSKSNDEKTIKSIFRLNNTNNQSQMNSLLENSKINTGSIFGGGTSNKFGVGSSNIRGFGGVPNCSSNIFQPSSNMFDKKKTQQKVQQQNKQKAVKDDKKQEQKSKLQQKDQENLKNQEKIIKNQTQDKPQSKNQQDDNTSKVSNPFLFSGKAKGLNLNQVIGGNIASPPQLNQNPFKKKQKNLEQQQVVEPKQTEQQKSPLNANNLFSTPNKDMHSRIQNLNNSNKPFLDVPAPAPQALSKKQQSQLDDSSMLDESEQQGPKFANTQTNNPLLFSPAPSEPQDFSKSAVVRPSQGFSVFSQPNQSQNPAQNQFGGSLLMNFTGDPQKAIHLFSNNYNEKPSLFGSPNQPSIDNKSTGKSRKKKKDTTRIQ